MLTAKQKQREKIKSDVVELAWRYLFVRFRWETEKNDARFESY